MRILAVGTATVDIVNEVDAYPAEDSETRCLAQRVCRGGNATNTLATLSRLGHGCHWAGALGGDPQSRLVEGDLDRLGVDRGLAVRFADGLTPTSTVILNRGNGSRTILHHRDLPEYPAAAFREVDPGSFDWIHFEGRAVDELAACLDHAGDTGRPPLSMEVEKPREGIEALFRRVDLLLFSRGYARHRGFERPLPFLAKIRKQMGEPAPAVVCAWGAFGAAMITEAGDALTSPAYPPAKVVDTLGAGDVFNAGVIDRLVRGCRPQAALEFACRLAGRKCGFTGLEAFPVD
jgi:ketohexokinase